jgi:RNA polymerase sigma factor (sigma-70 family)
MTLNEAYEIYRSNPSEEAMEKLYPLVREKVKRTIRAKLHSEPEEALVVTITNDVLMEVWTKPVVRESFNNWIEKAITNDVMDSLRQKQLDARNVPIEDAEETPKDFDSALNELYERAETVLTDEEQELLKLKLEGYEGAEIAKILEISTEAAWKRLQRISQKLCPEKAA